MPGLAGGIKESATLVFFLIISKHVHHGIKGNAG
jgi:hypothetical protein